MVNCFVFSQKLFFSTNYQFFIIFFLFSTKLYQVPAPPKFHISPKEITKVLAPEYTNFQEHEENLLDDTQFEEIKVNHTESIVEDLTEAEKKYVLR